MNDTVWHTLEGMRETQLKIKRSDFICRMTRTATVDAAKAFITEISRENRTATHNCWAYIIGDTGQVFHSSDAGEPGGTAGKPMLNTLQSYSLTQVAVVVTRYFGGVKLGIRGLMDAYALAVVRTIESRPLVRLVKTQQFFITVPYAFNDTLLHQLKQFRGRIDNTRYAETVCHEYSVEGDDIQKAKIFLESMGRAGQLSVTGPTER